MRQRQGVLVRPVSRMSGKQVDIVDSLSKELLAEEGLLCYNKNASEIFKKAGAEVSEENSSIKIKIPEKIIEKALETVPSKIVLGARDENNKLILDAHEPRVRFGSGSETNFWLDTQFSGGVPEYNRIPGSMELLEKASHLCEYLENCDFFIRCVNIQDKEIDKSNKDVNKFFISLNSITKHVQAGLTDIIALDDVIAIGEEITGGKDSFKKNPVLSFIACLIKSPLQMVDDTTDKFIEISKRRVPIVVSSSPMGGATAPFDEFGMVALINAELLAGITLNQIVSPGAPVLYGAVPVRVRLDNLNDMYGAPEFTQYNLDCAQMARHYQIPCYSTAGVGDSDSPGIQSTAEKLITLASVPMSGPQYLHYAFGLLERTNTFSPEQAVMDNVHIGIIKQMLEKPDIEAQKSKLVKAQIHEVMASDHKTFIYHLPLPTQEKVYLRYPLEDEKGALFSAHQKYQEINSMKRKNLPADVVTRIKKRITGIIR